MFLALSSMVALAHAGPARDALAELQKSNPKDPMKWAMDIIGKAPKAEAGVPKIMIIGDSWADVVGIGGNESFFERKLAEHGCKVSSLCIAIPGSTSGLWANGVFLDALKFAVKE